MAPAGQKGAVEIGPRLEGLLTFYAAVDRSASFLIRNKMPCSVPRLATMVGTLPLAAAGGAPAAGPGAGSGASCDDVQRKLQRLVGVSQGVVELFYVPRVQSTDRFSGEAEAPARLQLELAFRKSGYQGSGAGHAAKRLKKVRDGLVKHVATHHDAFLARAAQDGRAAAAGGARAKKWNAKKQGWHPDFDLAAVPLPEPAQLPEPAGVGAPQSTNPFALPEAPLRPTSHTGAAVRSPQKRKAPGAGVAGAAGPRGEVAGPVFDGVSFVNNTPAEAVPQTEADAVPLRRLLEHVQSLPFYVDQAVSVMSTAGRDAEYRSCRRPLHPATDAALRGSGIDPARLYRHQAAAIDAAMDGKHVCVATATASGKSLCFNVPVLDALARALDAGRPCGALYIFPTKALAQDQLRSLRQFIGAAGEDGVPFDDAVRCATFDGDCNYAERADALACPILLSNPDMLHSTVLPQHKKHRLLLQSLRFVVIDESHVYRGAFGSHVALVLRRLLRLCAHYADPGAPPPTFVFCSATIANPRDHVAQLVPLKVSRYYLEERARGRRAAASDCLACITEDYAPCGSKDYVIWQPPLLRQCARAERGAPPPEPGARGRASKAPKRSADECAGARAASPASARRKGEGKGPGEGEGKGKGEGTSGPPTVDLCGGEIVDLCGGGEIVDLCSPQKEKASRGGGEGGAQGGEEEAGPLASPFPAKAKPISVDPDDRPRSAIVETAMLFAALVKQRVRTLCFCRVRKLVELVLRYSLQDLGATAPALAQRVRGYRGGYSKQDRRQIERELFGGRLLGVTCSNALELGVDVGSVSATLHLGFPGSISSLRQQAGRAGRSGGRDGYSLCFVVLFPSPLDQHFARHPRELLGRAPEAATVDPFNALALQQHLRCAARELPLTGAAADVYGVSSDEELFGGAAYRSSCELLLGEGALLRVASGALALHPAVQAPTRRVSLRQIDPVSFRVVDEHDGGKVIDTVEYSRAFFELYAGAIYLHQATQYLVTALDLERLVARARPVRVPYHTASCNATEVSTGRRIASIAKIVHVGGAVVRRTVYGWRKCYPNSTRDRKKRPERHDCKLPPLEYRTKAWWCDVPLELRGALRTAGYDVDSSIHALSHAILSALPLKVLCDPSDVETLHGHIANGTGSANVPNPRRLLVFEQTAGGNGCCTLLFEKTAEVLGKARDILSDCACDNGCPACIHHHTCADYNERLDKPGAAMLAAGLLGYLAKDGRIKLEDEEDAPADVAARPAGDAGPLVGDRGEADLGSWNRLRAALVGEVGSSIYVNKAWVPSLPQESA